MESREQGLSVDCKEIEFPPKFARCVHSLVYDREKMRQIRDYMKKRIFFCRLDLSLVMK